MNAAVILRRAAIFVCVFGGGLWFVAWSAGGIRNRAVRPTAPATLVHRCTEIDLRFHSLALAALIAAGAAYFGLRATGRLGGRRGGRP